MTIEKEVTSQAGLRSGNQSEVAGRGTGVEVGLAIKVLAWEVSSVGVPSGVLQTAS